MAGASKKWSVEFDGVDAYIEQLKQYEGAAEKAVEDALKATQTLVADKCAAAMAPHTKYSRQGQPALHSIITDGKVEWTGETASIKVGFDIDAGGLPSIFLMHGTKVNGEQHIQKDQALFDAVYGSTTKKEAYELQQAAFDKVAKEVMK